MRVLFLTNMYPNFLGGMFIHSQARHLVNAGCEINVVVPVPYIPKRLSGNNRWREYSSIPAKDAIDRISVYYPRYLRFPGKWFHGLSCFFQYWGAKEVVRSLINEFKPSIIHAHAATVPGYFGLLVKKKYNLPLICSLRGSDINSYPHYGKLSMRLTKKLISGADQLISVSRELKRTANYIEKPKKEIKVIYNGCDTDAFSFRKEDRSRIRTGLNISENDRVLIFIGSLTEEKGIFELLTAFDNLSSNIDNLHLLVIGNGPERLKIQYLADSHGVKKRVHMIGDRPHNEIPEYLSASDILVLPSYTEGLPNVVLEAMACKLPVIATRVGGIPEAVEEGESGILVEKKSVDSLIESIRHLLNHEDMAKRMGNKGREIVKNKFSWEKSAEGIVNVYRDVIKTAC